MSDTAVERTSTLRIGIVSSFMPPHLGGLEVVAEALFKSYLAAGCDVRWVASRVPMMAAAREGGRIRVGCWNWLEGHLGVPWPIWGVNGIRQVADLVRWADVVHIHDCLYMGSVVALLCARPARKPVLLSQHIGFVWYRSALLRGLERMAYHTLGRAVLRHVSHVAFCTPAAEEFLTSLLGGRPAPASTIPYGVDTKRFRMPSQVERAEARQKLGVPEASFAVLFTGRLVGKKGVDLFLEVCRQRPAMHFLIVGKGTLCPPRADNLTWIPFIPSERMGMVYQAADVLLLPSHSEGFPLAILEAMAAGLPVITSRGQAFSELLGREGACLLADRTAIAFSGALDRLVEHPGLAEAMAARSYELVRREWSLEAMATRYLALLRTLAQNGWNR